MRRFAALFALLAVALCATAQTRDRALVIQPAGKPPEARHALIIGNSAYTQGPLKNPVNDARAMARALAAAGFHVRVVEDATHVGMQRAVRQWGDDIAKGGVGLFYYAGHGLQVKGKNFLVPVNADIDREDEIEFVTLDVNLVLAKMDSAKNALNIVILDACRNNPFARSFRSVSRGLAQMDAPTGTFIAFATAPGSVASDGAGENGLYTQHLLREMQRPGMPIEQLFKQVRNGVMKDTSNQQIPWESSSMRGDFSFHAGKPVAVAAAPAAPAAPAQAGISLSDMERMIAAALEKQRAMLEGQGLKVQAAPPRPAGPDPREQELKAAAERLAAERAAAEKTMAEARAAAQKAAAERAAAQKAVAELAAAEKAAADRTAAAKLATERAAAERIAAQKAAAELNAAADRATAERAAAEKERLQVAAAAPVSIAAAPAGGRMPREGDTWTYRLSEPNKQVGPKERTHVARVEAVSAGGVLESFRIDGEPNGQWVHGADGYLAKIGQSIFSPYLAAFQDLSPGESLGSVAIADPACTGSFVCDAVARVLAREVVKVPAGTFNAIKVRVSHNWRPLQSTGWGVAQMVGGRELTIWYAPELKRAVKFQSRLNVGDWPPIEANFDLDLVSYQLK